MSTPSIETVVSALEKQFFALGQMQAATIQIGGIATEENAMKAVTCSFLSTALNLWCAAACNHGKVTFAQAQQQVISALAAIARDGVANRRAMGLPVDEVLQ